MGKKVYKISDFDDLEDYMSAISSAKFKNFHNNRTSTDAYQQLKTNLEPTQENVVSGAMLTEINNSISKLKSEIDGAKTNEEKEIILQRFLSSDHVLFLNDHGSNHIDKVIEKAFEILKNINFTVPLNEFEIFILLCAIQIHDIGNVYGRVEHEKNLSSIFETACNNIIIDTPEKRVIKNIAMMHGGKNKNGNKDTISALCSVEEICGMTIRTRLLAAVLRFADELSDDCTRANRAALDLNLLGINSEIYHKYSQVLHTVNIEKDSDNQDYHILLVYELEAKMLSVEYDMGNTKKFLLDEIYDRTLKVEQERRYCMKFMCPFINIGRIIVKINIYDDNSYQIDKISYCLEDTTYPDKPLIGNITEIQNDVPSGIEELRKIREKGVKI